MKYLIVIITLSIMLTISLFTRPIQAGDEALIALQQMEINEAIHVGASISRDGTCRIVVNDLKRCEIIKEEMEVGPIPIPIGDQKPDCYCEYGLDEGLEGVVFSGRITTLPMLAKPVPQIITCSVDLLECVNPCDIPDPCTTFVDSNFDAKIYYTDEDGRVMPAIVTNDTHMVVNASGKLIVKAKAYFP